MTDKITMLGGLANAGQINDLVDIATLFGRDPGLNNEQDTDRIIDKMRDARFLFGKEGPARAKAKPKLTKGQSEAGKLNIDLDLDLKL